MQSGAITSSIDVAQLALYAFWVFFAGLILYLRGEDRREGYPLLTEPDGRPQGVLFGSIPDRKTFILPDGSTRTAPHAEHEPTPSLSPTGNPMIDAIGPASSALREDIPDRMYGSHEAKIAPMRLATDFSVEPGDPDPRGMSVIGADGHVGGIVSDVWVDRADSLIRYLEVDVGEGRRTVLFPMTLARFNPRRRQVIVGSVLAGQFATAPVTQNPDQVTLREEDRISAYFASGYLYAEPKRQESIL
jgi:photosynthetic reaction center H subunit